MLKKFIALLVVFIAVITYISISGAVEPDRANEFQTVQNGDWEEADTWAGGRIPGSDEAVVTASHELTLNKDAKIKILYVMPGAKLTVREKVKLCVKERLVREERSEIINMGIIEVGK